MMAMTGAIMMSMMSMAQTKHHLHHNLRLWQTFDNLAHGLISRREASQIRNNRGPRTLDGGTRSKQAKSIALSHQGHFPFSSLIHSRFTVLRARQPVRDILLKDKLALLNRIPATHPSIDVTLCRLHCLLHSRPSFRQRREVLQILRSIPNIPYKKVA